MRAALLLAACAGLAACEPPARTYLPPAAHGDVYAVIRYAGTPAEPRPTHVSVVWGPFRRSATFARPGGGEGVVLRLRHLQPDRVALTLRTSGQVEFGPAQGPPPPHSRNAAYRAVGW